MATKKKKQETLEKELTEKTSLEIGPEIKELKLKV